MTMYHACRQSATPSSLSTTRIRAAIQFILERANVEWKYRQTPSKGRHNHSRTLFTTRSHSHSSIQTFPTPNGLIRVALNNPALVGVAQSRNERPYQEDAYAVCSLSLPSHEVARALDSSEGVLRGKEAIEAIKPSSVSSYASTGRNEAAVLRKTRTSREKLRRLTEDEAGPGRIPGDTNADADDSNINDEMDEAASQTHLPKSQPKTPSESLAAALLADSPDGPLEQVVYCGVFDGHGGSKVAQYLSSNLHAHILSARQDNLEPIMTAYRDLGGYLRRYRGGILSDFVSQPLGPAHMRRLEEMRRRGEDTSKWDREIMPNVEEGELWSLHQRIHAAYLEADLEVLKQEEKAGAVATVCLLHSLPPTSAPHSQPVPFYAAERLHLLTAHLGDTRALLCTTPEGTAIQLTETHHPDARSETDRLMKIRTGAVADSFGETRWAGTLANTRGFGDGHYKALGVFAEPAIVSRIIEPASSAAFVVMFSDGVSESLSDQEVVDLVRSEKRPDKAAKKVVEFAESVGSQDNITCLVIPLPGWGSTTGDDTTLARREFRLANFEGTSNRSRRM